MTAFDDNYSVILIKLYKGKKFLVFDFIRVSDPDLLTMWIHSDSIVDPEPDFFAGAGLFCWSRTFWLEPDFLAGAGARAGEKEPAPAFCYVI